MKRFCNATAVFLLTAALRLAAAEYKLVDGTALAGEAFSVNESGMIIRQQPDGKLSPRINWLQFAPDTLKEIAAKDAKAKAFVDAAMEPPAAATGTGGAAPTSGRPAPLELKPVPRLERPSNITLGAALVTPVGFAMVLLLMLANLYAGFEVAIYRERPPALVIGVATIAPVLGPVLFLCLPTRARPENLVAAAEPPATAGMEPPPPGTAEAEANEALPAATAPTPAETAGEDAAPPDSGRTAILDEGEQPSTGLRLRKREREEATPTRDFNQSYKRGDHLINRRFFESKLTGFFRVVPGEAERDLVIVIRSARGEYVGQRISRISNDELHIQRRAGDASSETMIPFNDILEVRVQHKDAR